MKFSDFLIFGDLECKQNLSLVNNLFSASSKRGSNKFAKWEISKNIRGKYKQTNTCTPL